MSGWNQEEGKDPGLGISTMGYIINYDNCPIIWAIRIQTEIAPSTMEAAYIDQYQATRYVLPIVSFMRDVEFVTKIQGYTLTVM